MKTYAATLFAAATAIAVQASDLRIMSWNIEDAMPHSKAAFIASTAKSEKADILALQDVNVTPYNLINDLTEALGQNWTYRVTKGSQGNKQLAIFWNTDSVKLKTSKVPKAGAYEERSIQVGDKRNEPAQVAYFQKGAFDFFLINVNLVKAWQDHDMKLKQAAVLHDWVNGKKRALSGTENDFIVVGTFNFGFPGERVNEGTYNNPAYTSLSGNGLLTFTMQEVWKKDHSAFTYVGDWVDNDRLMDGFALSKPAVRHYVSGSSRIVRADQKFANMDDYEDDVSQHLPVIARFKTSFED